MINKYLDILISSGSSVLDKLCSFYTHGHIIYLNKYSTYKYKYKI